MREVCLFCASINMFNVSTCESIVLLWYLKEYYLAVSKLEAASIRGSLMLLRKWESGPSDDGLNSYMSLTISRV